jgi:hypothetical protein
MADRKEASRRKKHFVQVYLTEQEFEYLQKLSEETATPMSEIMRGFLRDNGEQFRNRFSTVQSQLQPA